MRRVADADEQTVEARKKTLLNALRQEALPILKNIAQQEGSSTGTGGSTSVTSKGLTSKVLSVASEYGALTQSTSNLTTTASGTIGGIPLALGKAGYFSECETRILTTPCLKSGTLARLSTISYSVSFPTGSTTSTTTAAPSGTSTGTATPVKTTSSDHSVSAFGFKWVAIPARLNQTAITAAEKMIDAAAAQQALFLVPQAKLARLKLVGSTTTGTPPALHSPLIDWIAQAGDQLWIAGKADPSGSQMLIAWENMADPLVAAEEKAAADSKLYSDTQIASLLAQFAEAYQIYVNTEWGATITQQMALPPILSVEYDVNRPTGQPSNSVVRVIYQKSFLPKEKKKPTASGSSAAPVSASSGKAKSASSTTPTPILTLTVNGAVSFYNSDQSNVPGAGYLRNAQFAAEIGHDFSIKSSMLGQLNFTLSTAGYYQDQRSPAILNVTPGAPVDGVTFVGLPATATKVFGSTGNIGLWQLKLTTGSGSSVKVPLSVTYSNRTELITKPTWKAQIGISYDFDSLLPASSSSSSK